MPCPTLSEQMLHSLIGGHFPRVLLRLPRHGGLPMTDTSKAHNASVNRDRQNMNLVKLIERYGDEDRCRAYLEKLRWPEGVRCPRCDSDKISRLRERKQFDCDSCRYQFSVTAG